MTSARCGRPIRLVLVSEDGLYRELLSGALARLPELEVVGALAGGREAMAAAPGLAPDVAVVDTPPGDPLAGAQLGMALRQRRPGIGIVLLGDHPHGSGMAALSAQDVPGWAYLVKGSVQDIHTVHRAIVGAAEHLVLIDADVLPRLAHRSPGPIQRLSRREQELLAMIALGLSNTSIARRFRLAEKTVENMVSMLYQQLDLHGARQDFHPRVSAALLYLRAIRGGQPT